MSSHRNRGESRAMVVLCGLSAAAIGTQAQAQEKPADKPIEEVVVTGSRIARPNLDSPVPVTTVTGSELTDTGTTSIGDMLNNLPSIRSTFSQSNSSRFLGTTGLNLLDLRGLGTQRTLVLVNGRRHVGSDILNNAVSPDVNTFPTDLIDRVDVVTGGDSAVYGSDAIAGVVNFVLKKDFEGLQFRGQTGETSFHDGNDSFGSVLYGTNFMDDKGNIAIDVEWAKQQAFFASDRPNLRKQGGFIVTDTDPAGSINGSDGMPDRTYYNDIRTVSVSNGSTWVMTPSASSGLKPCGVDPLGNTYNCPFIFQTDGTLTPQTGTRIGLAPSGSFDGGNGSNNRERNALAIYPDLKRVNFNVFGNLALSDSFKPFIEAKYVRTDSVRYGQPAFFQGSTMGDPGPANRERVRWDNPFLSDQARSVINAALVSGGLTPITNPATRLPLRRNMLDLGNRREDAKRETTRIVLGADGQLGEHWNYDVSINEGQFKEDTIVKGNLNIQRFLLGMDATRNTAGQIVCRSQIDPAAAVGYGDALDQAGSDFANSQLAADIAACVPVNPFGDGSITPAMRAYLAQDTTSVAEIKQHVQSAGISGDTSGWFSLPAGPIGVAFGLEHRTESNSFSEDQLVSSGVTFYNSIAPLKAPDFEVSEAYTEFLVPLLKDKPGAHDLSINLAGRYSDYKGKTGGVLAHNVGLEWAPIESLRFRVGKARAIRAPAITELYSQQSQNFATVHDPCDNDWIGTGSTTRAANCAAAGMPAGYDFNYTASLELVSGGNPDLKEETSDSLTAGFVWHPDTVAGFSLSVDYYDIHLKNAITAPDAQQILDACYDAADINNQFCSLFQRAGASGGPNGEQQFRVIEGSLQQTLLNYAGSKARGIDTEINYNRNMDIGEFSGKLIWTHALQRDDFLDPVNPTAADQVLGELGDPKDAANLNLAMKHGPVTIGWDVEYVGRMVVNAWEDFFSVQGNPPQNLDYAPRKYYPSVFYHNLRFGYEVSDKISAYVGVDNVANKIPPLGATGTGGGSSIYESRGRFMYAGAKVSF